MEKHAGLTYLRIKLKHLALEPALVKLEERKKRQSHQRWRNREYARIIEKDEGLRKEVETNGSSKKLQAERVPYENPWLAVEMQTHRVRVIRPEARAAQLAYAFLRGKSYDSVEPTSKYTPPMNRVAELVVKYGEQTDKKVALDELITWVEASGRFKWQKAGWFSPVVKEQKAAA